MPVIPSGRPTRHDVSTSRIPADELDSEEIGCTQQVKCRPGSYRNAINPQIVDRYERPNAASRDRRSLTPERSSK